MGACQPFEADRPKGNFGPICDCDHSYAVKVAVKVAEKGAGDFPAALDRLFLSCVVSKSLVLALLGHEFLHQKDIEHGISPGILAEVGCCSVPAIDIFKIQVVVP